MCALKLKLAAFATATPLQRRGLGPVFNTRGCLDMKSPELLTRLGKALPDGHKANGSASAGTAATADTAIHAGAVISLPAKSRLKFPESPTTAATPNT